MVNCKKPTMSQFALILFLAGFIIYIMHTHNVRNKLSGSHINEYMVIENIAKEAGTDKGAKAHNYTSVYYKYFAPFRLQPIKFLEIGIFRGFSARLWEAYFPNAELHFIDATEKFIKYRSIRSKYHIFDQSDVETLRQFAKTTGPFDLIIDDGGHAAYQIIATFKTLFPFLSHGGIYTIEDLHTAYWAGYGGKANVTMLEKIDGHRELKIDGPGDGEGTSIRFFKHLIDEVNFLGANTGYGTPKFLKPEMRERMSEFAKHIDSIHFHNSLCFVVKKTN